VRNHTVMKRVLLMFLTVLALPVAASEQAAPERTDGGPARHPATSFRRTFDAAGPLRTAYRRIGLAEALGASGRYLESARAHDRTAFTAYQQHDVRDAPAPARSSAPRPQS
jgi:hypothetical protein